jgi:hypothetical protein
VAAVHTQAIDGLRGMLSPITDFSLVRVTRGGVTRTTRASENVVNPAEKRTDSDEIV